MLVAYTRITEMCTRTVAVERKGREIYGMYLGSRSADEFHKEGFCFCF